MADRLAPGEKVLAGGFAWIARPRPKVPLWLLARRPHFLGLTDRRVLVWAKPRKRTPLAEQHLVLDAPYADVSLDGVRTLTPMLQVRFSHTGDDLVAEVRPRDRRFGHRLAEQLRAAAAPA